MRSILRTTVTVLLAGVLLMAWSGRADAQLSPSLSFSPASAPAGSTITIDGAAFRPGESVNVDYGGRTIAQAIADSSGRFSTSGTIDAQMPIGTHPIDANGSMGSFANESYTVTAPMPAGSASPAPAPVPAPAAPAPAAPSRPGTVVVTPGPDPAIVVAPPVESASDAPATDGETPVDTAEELGDRLGTDAQADEHRKGLVVTDTESDGEGLLGRLTSAWAVTAFLTAFCVGVIVALVQRRSRRDDGDAGWTAA